METSAEFTKQPSVTKQRESAEGADVPGDLTESARCKTRWCVSRASDVLETERASSDVLPAASSQQPAHEARGKGGGEPSKHSAEVDASQVRQTDLTERRIRK